MAKENKSLKTAVRKTKTRNQFVDDYKYDIGTIVVYKGSLFNNYNNLPCEIIKRSRPKGKIYYVVKYKNFDGEGNDKELSFAEQLLHPFIESEEDNKNAKI